MSVKHTIVINGKVYDAVTGLPLGGSTVTATPPAPTTVQAKAPKPVAERHAPHKAAAVHGTTQKSVTLRRGHLKTPASQVAPAHTRQRATAPKSPLVTHFAAHPQPIKKPQRPQPVISDMATLTLSHSGPKPVQRPSSVEIKERLIANAATQVSTKHTPEKQPAKKRSLTFSHVVVSCFALMLLGAYFAYSSMPGISVAIASSQAGVSASYPGYNPDGYSFEGPVTYQPGNVELSFKSNGGSDGYTISQSATTWNSGAVLDNIVAEASDGDYQTTSEGGVIVYTYGSNAAWSNGGVLYKIAGKAPLNQSQLLKIAASL